MKTAGTKCSACRLQAFKYAYELTNGHLASAAKNVIFVTIGLTPPPHGLKWLCHNLGVGPFLPLTYIIYSVNSVHN